MLSHNNVAIYANNFDKILIERIMYATDACFQLQNISKFIDVFLSPNEHTAHTKLLLINYNAILDR